MDDIARRYFIMNGFDGAMTMLGIVVGAWIMRVHQPGIIITTGLGGCLAMGISGLFGAYMAEKAERRRYLKMLEDAILSPLDNSMYDRASNFAPVYAALIDGLSPMLTAMVSIVPFILTLGGFLSIWHAYTASFILTLTMLFSLGLYLGKVAKENMWWYGIQMVAAGVITATILILLGGVHSLS